MKLKTTLEVDKELPSGRYYPRSEIETAIRDIPETLFLDADNTTKMLCLETVIAKVTSVYLEDDVLMVELDILNTPQRKKFEDCITGEPKSYNITPFMLAEVNDKEIKNIQILKFSVVYGVD